MSHLNYNIFYIFCFILDVRQGLIGVGLINVEDRSGILTLDKGNNMSFIYVHNYCCIITAHFVVCFYQFEGEVSSLLVCLSVLSVHRAYLVGFATMFIQKIKPLFSSM